MSDDRGLTLVELFVVMVIIGVLMVALGFQFTGWRDRYKAEGELRKLYMDMMGARAKALQTKTAYFINMPDTNQYGIYEDLDGDGVWDATDRLVVDHINDNAMIYNVTSDSVRHFTFSKNGMVDPAGLIVLDTSEFEDQPDCTGTDCMAETDYDCITVEATRINTGIWNCCTSECQEK